jgi:hypothetical protein
VAVTEWEPATEAEAAMRDALRGGDQEEYFRVLARTELLLPVSADSITGQAPVGWGTWTTSGRTHVLAFTSGIALQACLAENAGSARRMAYQELAAAWPNLEWWLAVNPGLPIEGYLPAWFVTQLARGDVRLPGRSMAARARLEKAESVARARATAVVPGRVSPPGAEPTSPASGPVSTSPAGGGGYGVPGSGGLAGAGAGAGGLTAAGPGGLATPAHSGLTSAAPGGLRGPDQAGSAGGQPARPSGLSEAGGGFAGASAGGPRDSGMSTAGAGGPGSGGAASGGPGGAASSGPGRSGLGGTTTPVSAGIATGPTSLADPGRGPAQSGQQFGGAARGSSPTSGPPESAVSPLAAPPPPPVPGQAPSPTTGPPPSAVSPLAAPPPPPVPGQAPSPSGNAGSGGLPRRVAGSAPAIPLGPIGANLPPISPAAPSAASATPTSAPPSNGTSTDTGAAATAGGRPWDTPPATQAWDPTVTGTPTQPWEAPAEAPPRAPAPPARHEPAPQPPPADFKPANDVEKSLLAAAAEGSTDNFLSTLLLARVLLPVSPVSADGTRPGEPGFAWLTETIDDQPFVVVFTSIDRLKDHLGESIETIDVKFVQLIKAWPEPAWSFAVNPSTPVGAKLPGAQILALANWAADVGLGGDTEDLEPAARPAKTSATPDPSQPTLMQKAVAPSQVDYYLERGYDRVSGFVHRANEVAHLNTPAKVYAALGLGYAGSAFKRESDEIYVLRWPAYRPSLYRIPYGGQNEPAMRAMEGWVIERAPFRGNGFAPSDSGAVVAEFKVDSARLPHGAQLWRITADGNEKLVALLDADAPTWRKVGEA